MSYSGGIEIVDRDTHTYGKLVVFLTKELLICWKNSSAKRNLNLVIPSKNNDKHLRFGFRLE